MKKKIILLTIIIFIIISVTIFIVFLNNTSKTKPENILQQYVSCINEKDYEKMYNMITEKSKSEITQENFIERNKNIYEGIDMSDMTIEIIQVLKENKNDVKIEYQTSINTSVGNIEFKNIAYLIKDKKEGYLIDWSSKLIFPELTNSDKVRIKTVKAERGSIVDKNGRILAGKGNVSSIGIVPKKLGDEKNSSIEKIASLLGISIDMINNELESSWVKEDSFVPLKNVAVSETELKNNLLQIPGVKITTTQTRVYPLGESAAQLIGYVQNITAEELEKNIDKGYTSTSVIGKVGLEKIYEERLKGKDGKKIYIEDENGNIKKEIGNIEVQNGEEIKLTIDSTIQEKLYNELKLNEGFFVVMEPKTGEILALVSTPSYDPNKFVLGMSNEEWNTIKDDERKPMLARYLQSWCPGSTFKPITGAIGLTTNSLKEEDTFSYNGLSWKKDSSWGNYNITTLTAYSGPKNLKNALIYSDNIYFAQAILQIGKDNFINELKKIKFGEDIDFILATSKSQYSNSDDIVSETQLADSAYGQGEILVNPIHMASIYSSFVNDGNMIKPYIEYRENKTKEYLVEGAFSKESANIIKNDLIQVIENPEGTANDMKVAGRIIAGKTGTAELKTAKDEKAETLGWFNCVTTDSNENQILVVSMVEDGRDLGGSHYLIKKIKSLF